MAEKESSYNEVFLRLLEKAEVAVDKSMAGLEKGVDFIMEQAPLVVQELLKYKFIEAVIYASLGWLVTLFLLTNLIYCVAKLKKWWDSNAEAMLGYAMVTGILTIFVGPIIAKDAAIDNTMTAVKIGVAPRVYLIEYCSDLIKEKQEKK